jgi:SEC-C motif-containing protein
MRARYAAFATGAIDFLLESHHPDTVKAVSRVGIEAWSRGTEWLGLTIVDTALGGEEDETGVVEFTARFKMKGHVETHRERSRFGKLDGRWYFIDGEHPGVV